MPIFFKESHKTGACSAFYAEVGREKAQNAFNNGDFLTAKNQLNPLAKYLIPTNIILGLLALVLGIRLRGL